MLLPNSPVRVHLGTHCVADHFDEVKALGKSCLIVTGKSSAQRCGAMTEVCHALFSEGIVWEEWNGVTPNPTVEECRIAGRIAAERQADFILGIGGGSAQDAAKAIAVFAANPELDEAAFYAKEWKRAPLPIVLVGTTAGTGSEVTKVSVLTDASGRKHSIHDDKIFAAIAYGDARYTESMSPEIRLSTGMDTLMHGLESYFSKRATDESRKESVLGVAMAAPLLMRFAEGEKLSPEELETLYEASLHAGLGIHMAGTGFPHKLGYWLTETFGMPHGFACAEFLDDLLAHVRRAVPEDCRRFEEESGIPFTLLHELRRKALPKHNDRVFPQEMKKILPRWKNDSSLLNTIGEITEQDIERYMSKYEWDG